jgi:hypothetical protein
MSQISFGSNADLKPDKTPYNKARTILLFHVSASLYCSFLVFRRKKSARISVACLGGLCQALYKARQAGKGMHVGVY